MGYLLAFIVGGLIGYLLCALMVVAREDDRW